MKIKKFVSIVLFLGIASFSFAESVVVYFSATGNTKRVAEQIAQIQNCEIIEIKAKVPYTAADLKWTDKNSRVTKEWRAADTNRPEIDGKIDLAKYDTIYLGYPIWYGQAPNIVYTFVEGADLENKTIYPFCTSGASGIGSSVKNLSKKAGGATWKNGKRFSAKAAIKEKAVKEW